ncbi:hypothetical protein MJA45_03125 [Paenibacillus aurantius]|uniref:Uncharacterized protein n=1 Tax=Paenibacillus aurantius TaxID=2918900 RepID=A0AA96LDL9_9BACL|nr:hypothetical protein [Paenibacillus aurantius]WNQ12069.1 hypothetical protein MJA45_03125 [Paenibacillus aurantius]
MNEDRIPLIIKAWETYQNLSKGFGENAWKVRTAGIGFWGAIIAYWYKNNDFTVYYISFLTLLMFFILEAGMRQLQQTYIQKSIELEKTINDYLVGDVIQLPSDGISTNISTPSLRDYFKLLRLKRWQFWLPYLLLVISTFILMEIR